MGILAQIMEETKWQLIEKVVRVIEKTLSPTSIVKHNVRMPDLTDSSNLRQCDVVIWTPSQHGDTITIVEVQDRKSKVDINTFDGWIKKKQKVGAQHLICVSRNEFPDSIKKEALKSGSTVRLITLNNLPLEELPIRILDDCIYHVRFKIMRVINPQVNFIKGEMPTTMLKREKYEYKNQEFTTTGLLDYYITSILDRDPRHMPIEQRIKVHLPLKSETLFYLDGSRKYEVTLDIEVDLMNEVEKVPITCSTYKQFDINAPLGWIMEVETTYKGKLWSLKGVLTRLPNGMIKAEISNPEGFMGKTSFTQVKN